MRNIVRNTHKYLSFFISVQLFLWTVSGIYFAFNKIELVRGEQYRLTESFPINFNEVKFSRSDVQQVKAINRLGETIFVVSGSKGTEYLDAFGSPVNKLNRNELIMIDGAHATADAQNLASYLKKIKIPKYGIWAMTKNKDPDLFIKQLKGVFKKIITMPRKKIMAFLNDCLNMNFLFSELILHDD